MTVGNNINRAYFVGDNSTTSFAFAFSVVSSSELKVYVDDVLQTITTNYTVSDSFPINDSGSSVVFGTAPATNAVVAIIRDSSALQSQNFSDLTNFSQSAIESALDVAFRKIQELETKLTKAISIAQTQSSSGLTLSVPGNSDDGKILILGSGDPPTEVIYSSTNLGSIDASVTAAANSASAASTSETNAATSETNASNSASAASSSETNASNSASASASSASDSAASAANASAITAGSLDGFVNASGTVNAVNNAQYALADGSTLNLPTFGANVSVQIRNNSAGFSSGITLVSAGKTFNGKASPQTIVDNGLYTIASDVANGNWVVYPGSARHYSIDPTQNVREITDNYTLLESDKTIHATLTAEKTVTAYASNGAEVHRIRNNTSSTHNLIFARAGADTIDDGTNVSATSVTIPPGRGITVQDKGDGWILI